MLSVCKGLVLNMTGSPQSFHKSSAEMVFFFLSLATNALRISLFDN